MEINNSQVLFMGSDKKKMCSFANYEKIADTLFGNIKIIVNNNGELQNISNYKIVSKAQMNIEFLIPEIHKPEVGALTA
jgi:hypothetical protein